MIRLCEEFMDWLTRDSGMLWLLFGGSALFFFLILCEYQAAEDMRTGRPTGATYSAWESVTGVDR